MIEAPKEKTSKIPAVLGILAGALTYATESTLVIGVGWVALNMLKTAFMDPELAPVGPAAGITVITLSMLAAARYWSEIAPQVVSSGYEVGRAVYEYADSVINEKKDLT